MDPRRLQIFRRAFGAFLLIFGAHAAVLSATPCARAQSVLTGGGLGPGVTQAHIERAEKVFGLDAEQARLLDAAYDEYIFDVEALAQQMRGIIEAATREFRETRDGGVWRDLLEVGERFEARREQLDRRLLGELRLLLGEGQAERWERFAVDRRRMIGLGRGGLVAGDSVDLVAVAEEAGADTVDPESAYAGVLREYAGAMDAALAELEAARRELDRRAAEALSEMDTSSAEAALEGFQPILEERLALAVAVRDVNKRFAARLERALPGAVGDRFGSVYRERVYPKVYRESTAERMARAVRSGGPAEASRVDAVMSAYRRERAALDAAWVEAIDRAEASATVGGLIAGMSEESEAERAAWRARRGLDMRTARELRSLSDGGLPEPASPERVGELGGDGGGGG